MRQLAWNAHIVAEPSGAAAPAAFLFHRSELPRASKTVAIVSGGNVAPEMLNSILAEK